MITNNDNKRPKSVMQFVDMEMLVPQDHLVRLVDKTVSIKDSHV